MAATNFSTLTPIRRLVRLLAKYRREIRYILLYAVVAGLINLSYPLGVQAIIGLIAGGSISASWGLLVLVVTVGALIAGALRLMQLSIMEYMKRQIFTDSALEFALRIPRLNLELLRREHLPELVNRFFDTQTIQKGLPKILIDGSTAVLQILFSLLLLSFYHSTFVLSSLLLLGILGLLFWWTAPLGLQTSLNESKKKYNLAYWLEEISRVAVTFKLSGENRFPLRRTDALTVEYLNARAKHWRILLLQFGSSVLFRALVLGGFLVMGSMLVMENQINLGQFVAAEILVLFIVDSVDKLILLHETAYDVLTATEKLGQVVDLPLEREGGIRVAEFSEDKALEVELRELSYQYSDAPLPTLQNLNLHIAPGERVAVAGYGGSGKSTLIKILSVQKRDFTGLLLFNGLTKRNLDLGSLRGHIGDFSSQEEIFKGSIRENISLGRDEVSLKRVLEVVELVGLDTFIREFPQGIDTELLPGGKNIPRSVITKILVARAIAGRPNLLVMEEPLNSLIYRDRVTIARLLTSAESSWTLVTVTEDPLLASLCDRVVVLQGGQIIFDGTFDAVKKTEHYGKLFRENMAGTGE